MDKNKLSDKDLQLCKERINHHAYYYKFEPTGCEPIDLIIGALHYAGKSYHHTQDWNNESGTGDIDADSIVDLIQRTLNEAAGIIPETKCTCGSGGHPRHCDKHPDRRELHIVEMNYENALHKIENLKDKIEKLV